MSWGQLIGYIDPIINGVVTQGLKGTNPSTNRLLMTDTGTGSLCDEIMAMVQDVADYNSGSRVNYAPLPNGSTTFNSNSFTYTLLSQPVK
jgi:hypothetical protein